MRIPRLLTILGPAAVLYVLAARASSGVAPPPHWIVASLALALGLSPLAVVGARRGRRASALSLMGVTLGVAVAAARSPSPELGLAHDLAWLLAVALVLDLALPRGVRPWARAAALVGYSAAAGVAALLSSAGLLPTAAFGVAVVSGLFAAAALHQLVLVGRGHAVEGALSGIAIVGLGVGLAYAWFGPFSGPVAVATELCVAAALWLGHLAWVDPRWRALRRVGVPIVVASAACFLTVWMAVSGRALAGWELGALAVVSGAIWAVFFGLTKRVSRGAVWSTSGRLADAAATGRAALLGCTTIDAVATETLAPFARALGTPDGLPELLAYEPPLRIRLDSGQRSSIRSGEPPRVLTRALMDGDPRRSLDLVTLEPQVVREPGVRELVDYMRTRSIGTVVPCRQLDHLEGSLSLPLGGRTEPLTRIELEELARLGDALGAALSSVLAQRRAESHVHELSRLKRDADERVDSLRGEVERLRAQCDALGRGIAEDQSLHVAYSPSMRRVQTRAIELAPSDEPIWVVAPAGSPVLPVARFIHDRGPRFEAPFVTADCAAFPPDDLMSHLFGSANAVGGWLTSAAGGTLLLRNLPAIPRDAQARLAAALTGAAASPRIIATSRRTLHELRPLGAVDPALSRRFAEEPVVIPSLAERAEDVPSLVLLAIDRACRILARDPLGIDQAAMDALVRHDWSGDVAELELVVELAVARAAGKTITSGSLPPLGGPDVDDVSESLDGTYAEVERRLLERALRRSGGNKSEAARRLGLKRTTFLDKLRRHGLEQLPSDDVSGSAVG